MLHMCSNSVTPTSKSSPPFLKTQGSLWDLPHFAANLFTDLMKFETNPPSDIYQPVSIFNSWEDQLICSGHVSNQ